MIPCQNAIINAIDNPLIKEPTKINYDKVLFNGEKERERFFLNILKIKFSLRIRFPICCIYINIC